MKTETNRIEHKRELTSDLEQEAIAFLNYKEGGIIYIGIDKTGTVVGVPDTDGDMLKIKDRLKNNIMPSCMGLFDVAVEKIDDKDIIKITFASGTEKPYHLKKYGMTEKGTFIRIGTAAEPMPQRMIETLFAKRVRNSLQKIKSPRQDLTFNQLKIYYEGAGTTLNDQFTKNLEMLDDDGKYNYVAYLLADVNRMSIRVAKYDGLDRIELIKNDEYGDCSLVKATNQVLDRMEVENYTLAKITYKKRLNQRLWDKGALKEAVINAIVHNDYTTEVGPKFEFFDDRIEITSVGGLPEGMDENDFFTGYSHPRNKELMRVFRDVDLVEHLGLGVPRILKSYGKECFTFSKNFLRMTFPAVKQIAPELTEQATEQVTKGLTPRQQKIVAYVQENGSITNAIAQEVIGISRNVAAKDLQEMADNGILKRNGETKGTFYTLAE